MLRHLRTLIAAPLLGPLLACVSSVPVVTSGAPADDSNTLERPACSDEQLRAALDGTPMLEARLLPADPQIVLPPAFLGRLYSSIANRWVSRDSLPDPADVKVAFTVARDGDLRDFRLAAPSRSARYDREVLAAVASAGIVGDVPEPPRDVPLVLEIRSARGEPEWRPFPLRIALDSTSVTLPAVLAPGNRPPRYPRRLAEAGVSGGAAVRIIVDERGRVDPSSITPTAFTHTEFLEAMADHLPRMSFYAAVLDDCTVPSWVLLPMNFYVSR